MKVTAEFIAHHPDKFEIIRKLDNVTKYDLGHSFAIDTNRKAVFKAGQGAGKSGSFFFFSYDNRFIIKTLSA